MDKYIETLDSLMKAKKEKKKKEPTVKEKDAFRNAWLYLATGAGFAGRAEQFLYEGFAFCGAEPFYAYLCKTEDPNATLAMLFNGKCYGNDSNVTFRLVTHLLALMLNDGAPRNILAPVIKRLPGACLNKDKKRLGTAEKTLEKYFLAELHSDVVLCPLSDVGTKPVFIKDFVVLVSSIIDGIESSGSAKGLVAANAVKIRKWFSDYETSQDASSEVTVTVTEVVPAATDESVASPHKADTYQEDVRVQNAPVAQPVEDKPEDMTMYLIDLLSKAGKAAAAVKAEGVQQKNKAEALLQELESGQEKLQRANQRIAELQDTIADLRKKLATAEGDIFVLKQDVALRDAVITERETEIAERIKMADVLSRDRSKQADESLQRLASKIRVEYRDFADALDIPMSCDLGENLRLQLQSIFDILEKGGMKIK